MRSRTHVEIDGIRKVLEETAMASALTNAMPGHVIAEGQLRSISDLTEGSA
jgi:hypothetical protein